MHAVVQKHNDNWNHLSINISPIIIYWSLNIWLVWLISLSTLELKDVVIMDITQLHTLWYDTLLYFLKIIICIFS